MSIRAYKIIKIEKESTPTFNLWHCHPRLLRLLNVEEQLDPSGGGYIYIDRYVVEDLLKDISEGNLEDTDALKEVLENILEDFDEDDDYVEYSCY